MVIGIFGCRNVGKSSITNILLGQDFSIVSDTPGTTADPAKKRIEIKGLGASTIIDTAGIDDTGELGEKRVAKSLKAVKEVDVALLVFVGNRFTNYDNRLAESFVKYNIPYIIVHNQSDILELEQPLHDELKRKFNVPVVDFSCSCIDDEVQMGMVENLLNLIVKQRGEGERSILYNLVSEGDNIVLVCPIDSSAPKNRLILPQTMAIRDILDHRAVAHVVQPSQLEQLLLSLAGKGLSVRWIVTDSQAFKEVSAIIERGGWGSIPLTSFSILLARSKGPFSSYIAGLPAIDRLKDNDNILILESCTHRATCDDIGRVKIPALLQRYSGKKLCFTFVPSLDPLPDRLSDYALALQCGGCMVTGVQLNNRIADLVEAGVPVTNYGMAISYMNGIKIHQSLFVK